MANDNYHSIKFFSISIFNKNNNQSLSTLACGMYGNPQVVIESQFFFLAKVDPACIVGLTVPVTDVDKVIDGKLTHTLAVTHLTRYADANAGKGL